MVVTSAQGSAREKHVLANRAGYSSRQPLRGWRHTYIVSAISARHRWVLEMRRAAAAGSHCPPSEEDPPPAPAPAPAPALLPPREAPPGAEDGLLMPIGPMNVSTSDGPQECMHVACDNNSILSEPIPLAFGRGRYTPTKCALCEAYGMRPTYKERKSPALHIEHACRRARSG